MPPDETGTPLSATPNPPVEPSHGTQGQVALHEGIQDLRERINRGEVRFASQAPKAETPAPTPPDGQDADPSAEDPATPETAAEPDADATATEPEADGGDEQIIRIAIGNRDANGEPFEIEVEDPVVADRIRQLKNDAMRGEEFKRRMERVQTREEQLAYIDHYINEDPIAFIAARFKEPEMKRELARFLLAEPGMLEALAPDLEQWDGNPEKRRGDHLEMIHRSTQRQREVEDRFARDREDKRAVAVMEDAVDRLSGTMDGRRGQMFISDAMGDLAAFYHKDPSFTAALNQDQILQILTPRIEMYGLTVEKARQLLSGDAPAPVTPAKPDAAAAARLAADAQARARKLVRASTGRRAAAAVGGVGTPAPVGPAAPPAGQGVKERISWLRQTMGLGKK